MELSPAEIVYRAFMYGPEPLMKYKISSVQWNGHCVVLFLYDIDEEQDIYVRLKAFQNDLIIDAVRKADETDYRVRAIESSFPGWELLYNDEDYSEYLKSSYWKQRRRRALTLADHKCQVCGSSNQLQVHHKTYANKGHEYDDDLIVLCADCHAKIHDKEPSQ